MISYSILHEYPSFNKTDLGKLLKKITTSVDKKQINTTQFSWKIYKEITNKTYNINPKMTLSSKVFESYRTTSSSIDNNLNIYDINL